MPVVAVLLTLALTGCSGTVTVDEPTPSAADQAVCAALMAALPATVLDQPRRTVEPGRYAAAWGKPVITLRCGVAKPPSLGRASPCYEVNGVGWYAEPGTTGQLFTTIGRRTFVEMGVPTEYAPEAGALVDVAAAVQQHDPVVTPCV